MVPIKDQPGLPRVLLIGDSISMCYTLATREELKGEANVHRIPDNAGHTGKSLEKIDGWLGDGKWDVIHFNWGLHDLRSMVAHTPEQYEQNLRKLVKKMQATGAKLIWCSSTPLPEDVARSGDREQDDAGLQRGGQENHGRKRTSRSTTCTLLRSPSLPRSRCRKAHTSPKRARRCWRSK